MRAPAWRAKFNPRWGSKRVHYFQRYGVSLTRGQARGGFTSHGLILGPFRWVGKLTINLTTKTITWDHPGAGSLSWPYGQPAPRRRGTAAAR